MYINYYCSEFIVHKNLNYKKKCKNGCFIVCKNKNLCYIHAKKMLNKFILFIQKIWAGYKCRKYINNIFKKLIPDLQNKIIFYIREPILLKKFHYKPIKNIIINNYLSNFNYPWGWMPSDVLNEYNKLIKSLYLFNKYHIIFFMDNSNNDLINYIYKTCLQIINNQYIFMSLDFYTRKNLIINLNNYISLYNKFYFF